MKICYCLMASHVEREAEVNENIRRVLPYIDAVVFVNGGPHKFEAESWERVDTVRRQWNDSFPAQRNAYLRRVDDFQRIWDDEVLIAVADSDEYYSVALLEQLNAIGQQSVENDRNQIAIQCHSITTAPNGGTVSKTIDQYWKGLLLLWEPSIEYIAVTYDGFTPSAESQVHEWLSVPSGIRYSQITDSDVYYEHRKPVGAVWLRAARNVWAGGGGKNLGQLSPLWLPFREFVQKHHPTVRTSLDFERLLERGNIHPILKQEILSFRHLGTEFDPRTNLWPTFPDATSEYREISRYYFIVAHPSELPTEIIAEDKGKIDWEREIGHIHGLVHAQS